MSNKYVVTITHHDCPSDTNSFVMAALVEFKNDREAEEFETKCNEEYGKHEGGNDEYHVVSIRKLDYPRSTPSQIIADIRAYCDREYND